MILGTLYIHPESGAVVTHRDSYLPENLTVVSVRRIALPVCGTVAVGLLGFTASFVDLLYLHEIVLTFFLVVACLFAGTQIGQLKLLSRDLRQSELSGVIYGRYRDLNAKRSEIIDAILKSKTGRDL